MAGGVEHHADVVLGLVLGERCARLDCPGDSDIEVVDLDVEVDHHLLLTGNGRPSGWLVVLLPLELELEVSLW